MEERATDILDRYLAEIRAGRKTLAQCVAEHPDDREMLERLVPVALSLVTPVVTLDRDRKLQARREFAERLHQEATRRQGRNWWWTALFQPGPRSSLALAIAGALVGVSLLATTSVALAARDALPGDPLYGVKTAIEHIEIIAAPSPEAKALVRLEIAARRLAEVDRALSAGRGQAAEVAAAAYAHSIAEATEGVREARRGGATGATEERLRQALDANLARQEALIASAPLDALPSARETLQRAQEPTRRAREELQSPGLAQRPSPTATRAGVSPTTVGPQTPAPTPRTEIAVVPALTPVLASPPVLPLPRPPVSGVGPGSNGVIEQAPVTAVRPPASPSAPTEAETFLPAPGVIEIATPEPPTLTPSPVATDVRAPGPDDDRDRDPSRTRSPAPSPTTLSAPVPRAPTATASPPRDRGRDGRAGDDGKRADEPSPTPTVRPGAPTVLIAAPFSPRGGIPTTPPPTPGTGRASEGRVTSTPVPTSTSTPTPTMAPTNTPPLRNPMTPTPPTPTLRSTSTPIPPTPTRSIGSERSLVLPTDGRDDAYPRGDDDRSARRWSKKVGGAYST